MNNNDLTEYIKKAFEYKADNRYKESIDYFYKALAIDNDSSEIMNELAYLYSKLHQYDRSVNFYEQILTKNPDNFKTRFLFAKLYKKLKEYKKAEEQFCILFEKDYELIDTAECLFDIFLKLNKPDKVIEFYNARANFLNSSLIYYYVANAYSEIKKETIAEEFYRKSFAIDENNIDSGANIAAIMFERGLYEETENLLIKLLKHSENDKIFYLLGEIFYLKNDYDSAIKYYSMAIRRNDKNAGYFYKIGVVYSLKGFLSEAEDNFCKAITLEHENVLYNYTLAYLYYMNDKKALALRVVDYILSLKPEYTSALSLKLLLSIESNDISEAGRILEKINNNSDKDEFAYYAITVYYSKINRWQKAIENILKAISYNKKSCEYNYELAKCYFNIKEYKKAEEVCNYIISINDKYINAFILLSQIFYELQDYKKSLFNIEAAIKLDMNIPIAYFIKGNILRRQKNVESAIYNYKTALSMSPDRVEYYESIAASYFELKDFNSSYYFYKEAADIDVANDSYRYFMAKCSEFSEDIENALVNYSVAKRLAPQNVHYICEYAKCMYKNGKKKSAQNLIKSSMKIFKEEEKKELKQLLSSFK